MADVTARADKSLARLDRKVGKQAVYQVFVSAATNTATGTVTQNFTAIENVCVRNLDLSARDHTDLANAGLTNVEAALKIRKAYVAEPKRDDEVHLTTTGFKYRVLGTRTDRLEADHILYTQRIRV